MGGNVATSKPDGGAKLIRYYDEIIQGSEEWYKLRCGMLTASEMKLIITPTLKVADNDKVRSHMWELLAQRVTGYVEPTYVSDDMMRGHDDELDARIAYNTNYAPVTEAGFVTNDKWGFTLGCSPDGLVGDDGVIEGKSRRQKFQIETISKMEMPEEYQIQVQTILLVTERQWCDFISYSGGLPMVTIRVYPDAKVQEAIVNAAKAFEDKLAAMLNAYNSVVTDKSLRLLPTIRKNREEIIV